MLFFAPKNHHRRTYFYITNMLQNPAHEKSCIASDAARFHILVGNYEKSRLNISTPLGLKSTVLDIGVILLAICAPIVRIRMEPVKRLELGPLFAVIALIKPALGIYLLGIEIYFTRIKSLCHKITPEAKSTNTSTNTLKKLIN